MKYVKKPIVIEASPVLDLATDPRLNYGWPKEEGDTAPHPLDGKHWVSTANGPVAVEVGDYVIKEPVGPGYYPCKPDIFEATYDRVE